MKPECDTEMKQSVDTEKEEKQNQGFLYKETMKKSRALYKSLGISLFLFLILYSGLRDYVIVPLMGKVWGFCLSATPEGFISTSNFLPALLHCPWILLVGAVLVVFYAILAMLQGSAIIIAIGYMRKGLKIRVRDLFTVSLLQLRGRLRKENWPVLLYALVIVPLANVYQTSDLVSRFVIPEYIQDFIESKLILAVPCLILALGIAYLALKWFFLLPSFILKTKNFKEAGKESVQLTEKGLIRNGINIGLYNIGELIRISIIPVVLILLPVFICYLFTYQLDYATSLFNTIGITCGAEIVRNVTGTMVQVSTMCFLVELYFERLSEYGLDDTINLPELNREFQCRISITVLQVVVSVFFAILVAAAYLGTVLVAQEDNSIIYEIFGRTEVIAHKGYSSKAPENTMPAFELADKSEQVTYIELDVWSSSDGIPVVVHNASIKDATGIDKLVYECTYEELQKYPAPYSMEKEKFPDARIPSLEEVIAKYADSTPLLIEIKGFTQDPELPAKIVALMKKYGCEYTSLIHSGNYGALEAVKKIDPDIRCGLILAMVTGNYYDLPYADFFSIEHTFVSQNTVSQLHRRGKKVYAWTVNYKESAEGLRFTGVDGIITDVPDDIDIFVSDTNQLIEDAMNRDLINWFGSEEALQNFENGEY